MPKCRNAALTPHVLGEDVAEIPCGIFAFLHSCIFAFAAMEPEL
jgi:hypothetical protein